MNNYKLGKIIIRKKIAGYIGIGVFCGIVLIGAFFCSRAYAQQKIQSHLAEKVLRFHVLANSDSTEDQDLKQKVRDAIGSYLYQSMQEIKSKEACERFLTEVIPDIEKQAKMVIEQEGFAYEVQAEIINCYFPIKAYGSYTFPEGNYDALRVTVGEGKGQNWWCVMYPNMCFVNSLYEVADEETGKVLRAVLDEEEYQTVLNSGKYEVRWKFLEYLEYFK